MYKYTNLDGNKIRSIELLSRMRLPLLKDLSLSNIFVYLGDNMITNI